MKRLMLITLLILFGPLVSADTLTLKSGHPDSYVVKKGDTLWDISAYFLNDPWMWPKLWGANPQVANPHLIYPGDRLTLEFIDGVPRLVVKPHITKSVEGRVLPKQAPIPAVDLSLLRPYLTQHRVVDGNWFEEQPLVLGGESESKHHIVKDIIYIQADLAVGSKFGIYAKGRELYNRENELLGLEVLLTGTGRVVESGPVSKIEILSSFRETNAGNRVLPIDESSLMSAYFMPRAAELEFPAYVIAANSKQREMGKLDAVYLDRGEVDGVETGHVFSIFRQGEGIVINSDGMPVQPEERNTYESMLASISDSNVVNVPDIYRGKLMVFKVFEKTSLALIMINEKPVRVDDKLLVPTSLLVEK